MTSTRVATIAALSLITCGGLTACGDDAPSTVTTPGVGSTESDLDPDGPEGTDPQNSAVPNPNAGGGGGEVTNDATAGDATADAATTTP